MSIYYYNIYSTIVSTVSASKVTVKIDIDPFTTTIEYKTCSGLGECVNGECVCCILLLLLFLNIDKGPTYSDPVICQIANSDSSVFKDGSDQSTECIKHGEIEPKDDIGNDDKSKKHQYCKCYDGYDGGTCLKSIYIILYYL